MSPHKALQARVIRFLLAPVVALVVSSSLPAQDSGAPIRIVVVTGEGAEHRTGQNSLRMKILVDAGLVEAAKHGRWVYYDLNRESFASVVEALDQYQTAQLATRQTESETQPDHGGL